MGVHRTILAALETNANSQYTTSGGPNFRTRFKLLRRRYPKPGPWAQEQLGSGVYWKPVTVRHMNTHKHSCNFARQSYSGAVSLPFIADASQVSGAGCHSSNRVSASRISSTVISFVNCWRNDIACSSPAWAAKLPPNSFTTPSDPTLCDSSGPRSRSDALCAIIVNDWREPSMKSQLKSVWIESRRRPGGRSEAWFVCRNR